MFWEELEHLAVAPQPAPGQPPSRYRLLVKTFRCADGEYVGVHTGAAGSHGRLMEVLGLSERVAPAPPGVQEKPFPLSEAEALIVAEEVPRIFASRPRAVWLDLLRRADVTAIPLLRQTEAFGQPQVLHNQVIVRLDDPELGPLDQVGVAARLGATPGGVRGPAPRPGQHTRDVLAELGYGEADIDHLVADGARSGRPVRTR
jgi:crotonobetainyl-CoA:carnitine CoA-transferase CaiB-like acyl-CoA transferase